MWYLLRGCIRWSIEKARLWPDEDPRRALSEDDERGEMARFLENDREIAATESGSSFAEEDGDSGEAGEVVESEVVTVADRGLGRAERTMLESNRPGMT